MPKTINIFFILTLLMLALLSCNTISCYKRANSLAQWISSEKMLNCAKPEVLSSKFSKMCWDNDKEVEEMLPEGIIGTVVCNLCLDYPLAKLNDFLEDAECKKKIVNKATRETLINLCISYIPFQEAKD